jgi:hypothetical protein
LATLQLALLFIVWVSTAAMAQDAELSARPVTIRGVKFSGAGCLAGDAIGSFDDSRTRATLIFSANIASAGPGLAAGSARKTCDVELNLASTGAEVTTKVLLIVRGHAELPAGASSDVVSQWSWSGAGNRNEQRDVLQGGENGGGDSYLLTREFELDTSARSDGSPLTVTTTVSAATWGQSFVTIDSVDVALGPSPVETSFGPPDATPPNIIATPSAAPSAGGWFGADVLVSFTCDDPESPIVPELSDLEPKLLEVTGEVQGSCVNVTGSKMTARYHARIDKTRPLVLGGVYPGVGLVALGAPLVSAFACADAESGIASCSGPGWLDTTATGLHIFNVTVTDRAGHKTTAAMSYHVGGLNDCAADGWRNFSTPMFRNENECAAAFVPSQKGK